jgi:hypothetical protein
MNEALIKTGENARLHMHRKLRPFEHFTEQCGHKIFEISGFWANYGQPAPYPSLAVRARNGRVADHPDTMRTNHLK